ncbi:MAG: hypothetical protein QXH80_00065 [Candidatus Nanoarchaeia archaeon]
MAIERFSYTQPCMYQGLEDYVDENMQEFVTELIRRLDLNIDGLVGNLREQVVVEKSLLPAITGRQAGTNNLTLVTDIDAEGRELEEMLWQGA